MATIDSQKIRNGQIYSDMGASLLVLTYSHMKRGRGQATIRLKVKNVQTGAIVEKTYSNNEKLELVDSFKKSAQFLYVDNDNAYFMDSADYTQFTLSKESLESELNFLVEGTKVVSLWIDDEPVSVELPGKVELEIVKTSPAVAGDTVSGATKEIELETGYTTYGPLFLKMGDKVLVNVASGEYVSRA